MAQKLKQNDTSMQRIVETYDLGAKFAEWVFCPADAIDGRFYHRAPNTDIRFRTTDGVIANPCFEGTWNNTDGMYDEEFERICQDKYGRPFMNIRSIWVSRLGKVDDYWHLIRLER